MQLICFLQSIKRHLKPVLQYNVACISISALRSAFHPPPFKYALAFQSIHIVCKSSDKTAVIIFPQILLE